LRGTLASSFLRSGRGQLHLVYGAANGSLAPLQQGASAGVISSREMKEGPGRRADRRVVRSRRRLHAALVELILERGWERVTVQEVCGRANVGRSTFYAHYADKEDLLVGGLDLVRDGLLAALRKTTDRPPFEFLHGLIEHANQSRRLFRAIIGRRSGLAVQRRFREVVVELVEEELVHRGIDARQRPTLARYLAGALVELLIWAVDARTPVNAAALETEFVRLSVPVLAVAARG
jgi:AcrR family transcriptional regulator